VTRKKKNNKKNPKKPENRLPHWSKNCVARQLFLTLGRGEATPTANSSTTDHTPAPTTVDREHGKVHQRNRQGGQREQGQGQEGRGEAPTAGRWPGRLGERDVEAGHRRQEAVLCDRVSPQRGDLSFMQVWVQQRCGLW